MQISVGFEIVYDSPQPTPMILNLNIHFTRVSDLVGRDDLLFEPGVPMAAYRDSFGNWCLGSSLRRGERASPPTQSPTTPDWSMRTSPSGVRARHKIAQRIWLLWSGKVTLPNSATRPVLLELRALRSPCGIPSP